LNGKIKKKNQFSKKTKKIKKGSKLTFFLLNSEIKKITLIKRKTEK
jgi:hypothetical protein